MKTLVCVAALTLFVALPSEAREYEGVKMEETTTVDGKTLTLSGMGLREKWFFDVYVIGLYLEDTKKDALEEQVRQVRMVVKRDLTKDQVGEAIRDGFQKNSAAEMPKLKERLDKLHAALPNVKEGQSLILTYVPGKGTAVNSGGKNLVTLEGKDFGDALFKVWLGKNPADADLKARLLGKSK